MQSAPPAKGTKAALLEAAEPLFLMKGFEAVSIREITEAANANVAAINYHFNGKVNLYREVLSICFAEVARKKVALIEGLHNNATLYEIIEAYVRSYFEDILVNPGGERLMQIVYEEASPDSLAADLVISKLITPVHQALHQRIKACRPDLSEQCTSRAISSITGQVLHFIRFRDVVKAYSNLASDLEFIDEMTEHITRFSLQGIGSTCHAPS